ncbi:MAG: LysM peptidoglycan-binding domain-containing protein [Emergencia sp.]
MNNILFCIDVYTVTEGDTLYSIAEKYDLPVSLLMKVNGISDPYNLLIGTRLCIPGDISQLPAGMRPDIQAQQESQHVHAPQNMHEHHAAQATQQAQQAAQMQARQNEQAQQNMNTPQTAQSSRNEQAQQAEQRPMGQRPPIMPPRPSAPAAGHTHQHQAHDQTPHAAQTPHSMQNQQSPQNSSAQQTQTRQNPQTQQNMGIPQVIEIPVVVERAEPVQMPASNTTPAPAPKPKTHTVKAGDTLYLIARMHNIRLDDLMDANPNVDPYNLMIGTILRLPY